MAVVSGEIAAPGRGIGLGVDRVDGPLKVTGAAPYSSDFSYPDMAHVVLVQAIIAAGRVRDIDAGAAEAAPGVLAVVTHLNAPRLAPGPEKWLAPGIPPQKSPPIPLQDDRILHYGQFVAMVVAETAEQAVAAARLVAIDYERVEPIQRFDDARAELLPDPWGMNSERGDVAAGLSTAEVRFEATFTTAENTNNPLGLFATVAVWEGDALTIHDATQGPRLVRRTLAAVFGIPDDAVRVLSPFLGGGFGAGTRVWPHVPLTALAARMVQRPVKLVLTRPQMFTSLGHRPPTVQHLHVGINRDGELVALDHEATSSVAMEDDTIEVVSHGTASAYACANVAVRDRQVRLNIPCPGSMRAPGAAEGNFALESALDELAYTIGIDPLDLRLRNYAQVEPGYGLPWSSNALLDCYRLGAERFGWAARNPEPRSMRDGRWLIGYGMAGATFHWYQLPCQARATVYLDGTAFVRSAASDIGNGTYTVMTQVAAEALGLPLSQVRFGLGDSDMPDSPEAGASSLTVSLGNAVMVTCAKLVEALIDLAVADIGSPLHGLNRDEITFSDGRLYQIGELPRGETYSEILSRHDLSELTVDGESTPPNPMELGMWPAGAFLAHFVEVRVDPDLGLIRVARVVTTVDGGRILNEKLARSQITGSIVGGIGMALFEDTVTDPGSGRIANATFGDYLVPVNADIPELDVVFTGEADRLTPLGTKGVGEVGLVGIAAAIANAIYHATGVRVRDLPITLDRLL